MRTIAVFLSLMVAASLAQAQTAPATKPAPAVPPAPATPVKPANPAKKEVKKEVPLPKIPGTVINRANGTFLSLEVVNGNFVLSFYDKKHKLMTTDVTRVAARWPNTKTGTPSDWRTILNGTGSSMVGTKPVLPPHNFNVYLTLLKGEGEEAKAVETYTVRLGS